MEKIESFRIDHETLLPGLYLSRRDKRLLTAVSTYDLRFTAPNREPPMEISAVHTIEHLGATYLRNSARKADVVYFGPMGCRTGFYLLLFGAAEPAEIADLVRGMLRFILGFEGDIPGASPAECGNALDHNLPLAKYYAERYLKELEAGRFVYPE